MASFSQNFMIRKAFFHNFGRVSSHSTQNVYESIIKNAHRVLANEVWVETIPFALTQVEADNNAINFSNIIKKHEKIALSPISGTNNQLYRVLIDNQWINQFIAPVDIVDLTGITSNGYAVKLYDNNDNLISLTEGAYVINYYTGMIEFQEGYTPVDLNYSLPLKITFYEYIGKKLSDISIESGSKSFKEYKDRFTVTDNSQLEYTLTKTPVNDSEKIFVQGVFKDNNEDYTIVDNKITFKDDVLEVGKKIVAIYTSGIETGDKVLHNVQYFKALSENANIILEKENVEVESIIVTLNGMILNKFINDYSYSNNSIVLYDINKDDNIMIYYSYTI